MPVSAGSVGMTSSPAFSFYTGSSPSGKIIIFAKCIGKDGNYDYNQEQQDDADYF